ncbi:MAB_1171c family putative transporter [Streptomyces sp. NBC_00654]|uniref:MAB_1171c family putative transporter n=1 Tax=Streptomyces sp. NBC_00654 TaxID=2975799 RepID=UPI002B1CFE0D|nr:MAB_1171c family putative transporter [Streptomyces sp. NBC_00654]
MSAGPSAVLSWFNYFCVSCLWLALALRGSTALRTPEQRGLWLAVATATVAITLTLPAATQLALQATVEGHSIVLARNLIGVLSSGAVLYFVSATVGGRSLLRVCSVTILAMVSLLITDALAPPHQGHTATGHGAPDPSTAYWLILVMVHLIADFSCTSLCRQYSRRTSDPVLKASLGMFGIGTALSFLYWLCQLISLLFHSERLMPYLPYVMGFHGLLRAIALLAPTLWAVRGAVTEICTIWRLWPLWHDLVQATPDVAFLKPRHRLLEIMWPQATWQLLAYRKIIETRDAILVLNDYVAEGAWARARRHVARMDVAHSKVDATVLACVMAGARNAKLADMPQEQSADSLVNFDKGDLDSEKSFLLDMARAYVSPPTRKFVIHADTSTRK